MRAEQGRFSRWWQARTPLMRIILSTVTLLVLFLVIDLVIFRRLANPVTWLWGTALALLLAWSQEWQRRRNAELNEQDRMPPAQE